MNHFHLQIIFVTVHNTCHLFNNISSTVRNTVLATNEELQEVQDVRALIKVQKSKLKKKYKYSNQQEYSQYIL